MSEQETQVVGILFVSYICAGVACLIVAWFSKKSNRVKFEKLLGAADTIAQTVGGVVGAFNRRPPKALRPDPLPVPPNVGSSAVVVRNVCLRHGCSLIPDSAFPNRVVCPQCQNERAAAEFEGLTASQTRHRIPDDEGDVQVFMTQEQYRDYMRRPSDRDLEVARHIQQEMMTTAVPNTGSWGITSREVNLKQMSHKEVMDAFTVKGEPPPKELSPEEKFQQSLKSALLPWLRVEGDTVICTNCGSRRVLLYIMIPETLTSIKAFADLHRLCKPPRSEREFEIAEG